MNQFIHAIELESKKELVINTSHIVSVIQTAIYTPDGMLHGSKVECINDKEYHIQGGIHSVLEAIEGSNNSVPFNEKVRNL